MAKDDVRLRDLPKKRISQTIRNQSRPVKGVDTQGLLKQASNVVSAKERAQEQADKLFEQDFRNRNKQEMYKSWARIGNAEKLNVHKVRAEENKRLNEFRDKMMTDANISDSMKRRLEVGVNQDRLPYEKFQILHTSKETESYVDTVNNNAYQLEVQGAVSTIGDVEGFQRSLDRVKEASIRISNNQGFDSATQELDGIKGQGNAVLASMKAASEMQMHDEVQRLNDTYESTFVTAKQKQDALSILNSNKKSQVTSQAIILKNQAFATYGDDFNSVQRSIEESDMSGEVKEEALQYMRLDFSERRRRKKEDEDNRFIKGKNMILDKGPNALQQALVIAPNSKREDLVNLAVRMSEGRLEPTNPEIYNQLIRDMEVNPFMFADIPIEQYRGAGLSDKDYNMFLRSQQKIKRKFEGKAEQVQDSTVGDYMGMLNRVAIERGFAKGTENYAAFVSTAADRLDDILSSTEGQNITDKKSLERLLERKVRVEQFITDDDESIFTKQQVLEDTRAGVDTADIGNFTDNINDEDLERIKKAWSEKTGRDPRFLSNEDLNRLIQNILIKKTGADR